MVGCESVGVLVVRVLECWMWECWSVGCESVGVLVVRVLESWM